MEGWVLMSIERSESQMNIKSPRAVVCGAGGFIGGHLVKGLLKRGVQVIRAVDIKPLEEWYQVTDGVENLSLDLMEKESCLISASGADHIYQLASQKGSLAKNAQEAKIEHG